MNRRLILNIIILITLVMPSSCGPVVKVTKLSNTPLESKAQGAPILVFMTKVPRCPYEEIAIINTSEGAFAGGMETFVEAMKVKARSLGGDALLLGELGTKTEGYIALSPGLVAAAEGKTQTAVVIRFIHRDCME